MISSHRWIYDTYSSVVRVVDTDNGSVIAYDANDNEVDIDLDTAVTKSNEHLAERALGQVRSMRNKLLLNCDWTQNADAPITAEKKAEWGTYRQSLRDITNTYTSLDDVVWPEKPE